MSRRRHIRFTRWGWWKSDDPQTQWWVARYWLWMR